MLTRLMKWVGMPILVQLGEDVLGNAVVEHALAVHDLVLLLVECGRIVLEELDQGARFRSLIKNFGFAFVNTATFGHELLYPACPLCSG